MPDQPADPIPPAPAPLSRAETIGLGNASRKQLIQIVEELHLTMAQQRRTFEDERAVAMCQAYERGVLDERSGCLPSQAPAADG